MACSGGGSGVNRGVTIRLMGRANTSPSRCSGHTLACHRETFVHGPVQKLYRTHHAWLPGCINNRRDAVDLSQDTFIQPLTSTLKADDLREPHVPDRDDLREVLRRSPAPLPSAGYDSSRYSLGGLPVHFLKARRKFEGSLKPSR